MRTPERREERFARMKRRQMRLASTVVLPPRRMPSEATERRRERLDAPGAIPDHMEMFRVKEVAKMLGVCADTVREYFRDRAVVFGNLKPGVRPKQTMLISRRVLNEWIREHQAG